MTLLEKLPLKQPHCIVSIEDPIKGKMIKYINVCQIAFLFYFLIIILMLDSFHINGYV